MEINEVKEDLERFENLIKMYNFEFTQFFAGNMKFPPVVREREINKIIRKYNMYQITNPTLRFRFNNLVARFITYRERWNRKMMEAEGIKKSRIRQAQQENLTDHTPLKSEIDKKVEKELEKLPESYNKEQIKKVINKKIDEIKSKGYNDVEVRINMVNGKPKLLIRPRL